MKKKILWLVTARAGSKSISNKNIKILGGHPLLSHRIRTALLTNNSFDIWISTDSVDYANIAAEYGAKVPFIRPASLSDDSALSVDVVLHAMNYAKTIKAEYDYIGLLEPTSPFVSSEDLNNALKILDTNEDATAIVAVKESRPNKIFTQGQGQFLDVLAANLEALTKLGRQGFPKEITPSGGFYISRWDTLISFKTFYTKKTLSYEVDDITALEIDEPIDWLFAEFIIERNLSKSQLK